MKQNPLPILARAVLFLVVAPAVFAQMSGNDMLFNPPGNLSAGAQNGHVGTAGGVFLTTYSTWPSINWLGYYDKDGDGLANSHQVSLWYAGGAGGDGSSTPIATVTVPAGAAAPWLNGYRWVELPSTVGLWYGSWYVVGAQTDGVDTWGDLLDGSAGQLTWDTDFVGDNGGWSRAGRYDSSASWPNPPGNQTGLADSIYPVANVGYNLAIVPEPATAALLGLAGALIIGAARRRKV